MCNKTGRDEPRVYVGAYALCLDSLNRLLLCRISPGSADEGNWTLPGGGIEWGETPAAAVVRELQEETGLEAGDVDLAGSIFSKVYAPEEDGVRDPVHHIGVLYRVHIVAGGLRAETAGTTDDCAWFSRKEAKQLPLVALGHFGLDIAWGKQSECDQHAGPGQLPRVKLPIQVRRVRRG